MALALIYILPMLFVFVFIPKSEGSAVPIETEGVKSTVAETVEVSNDGIGQEGHSENVKRRHGHNHRKSETNVETISNEKSKTVDEMTDDQEIPDDTQEETDNNDGAQDGDVKDISDGAQESINDNVGGDINEEITDDAQEITNDNEDGERMEIDDDDDAISDNDDADETDIKESSLHSESDQHTDTTKSGSQKPETPCPKCTNKVLTEKDIKIEMVKQHLLQKLGLPSAPKVDGPLPPLPFDFYVGEDFSLNDQEEIEEEEKRRNVKTRELFIFGEDITNKCAKKKGTGCYSFNTTSSAIDPDLVSSIELWIYKQPDVNDHHIQEFMVSELEPYIKGGKEVLRFRNIVKRIDTRLKYGWMKIYVRRSVIRWLSKPHRNHGLAVVCKTCQRQNHKTIYGNKEGYMPILVFYMKQHSRSHRRYRRHTECIEGGMNCCHKETLEINFHDIGWDYIMTPDTIRPNFCTGSCNGIRAAYYNHTRLVQTLQQSVTHNFAGIQTCCSPVSFARPQSLLYRDHYGVVRKVDVPDLIVGECGCT
ncbi:growth/differentiation factor 8-like [Mercenaria mercenaria]|uniref:growth/differentiation factor 8-like n=1 Tax=Mercenaria mercenaria TaxID=6596 RepID=UPI00234F1229|nr:growth/differentiation factor 8-like [Mercenaria mercenaria]